MCFPSLGLSPFGVPLPRPTPPSSPFGYTGEWTDALIGLQYLRARWHNPTTGRFTQVDPFPGLLSLPGTQHPYAYGLNNPVRYTDPSGEFVGTLLLATAAYVGGYLAYDYLDNHIQNNIAHKALDVVGLLTGWKNIKKDVHIINNPCTTQECKALAYADITFNGAMGIITFMGIGSALKSMRAAWAMRSMNTTQRLAYLRGVAGPGVTVRPGSEFFRVPGKRFIWLKGDALDDAGRLAGGFFHELAHVRQEFGTPKLLRWAPRGLQRLSAWTTRTLGGFGTLLPTYVWNPVEVHAATSGLFMNWANLALPVVGKTFWGVPTSWVDKYLRCGESQ
jgi:RHS repeat-associated protein